MQQDTSDSVIFVGSFSKILFRGLRLGFIVSPQAIINHIIASQRVLGVAGASAMQPALAHFMQSGGFVKHLRKMRRHYLHKRDYLLHLISDEFPLGHWYEWQKPTGGMHLCLYLKEQFKHCENSVEQHASEVGLKLLSLSSHFLTKQAKYGFLLGFSQPSTERLKTNIALLAKATKASIPVSAKTE